MSERLSALSDTEKYLLLRLSYRDLPGVVEARLPVTVQDWLSHAAPPAGEEALWAGILQSPALCALSVLAYENDNPNRMWGGSGFVAYAFGNAQGDTAAVFRGSEQDTLGNLVADWGSNVAAAFGVVIRQQRQADQFFRRAIHSGSGQSWVMGHSKGGNLAAYAYAQNLDARPLAYIVNGQPLYWPGLTPQQQAALRSPDFDFIVQEGDVVSCLGYVDYVRRVVAVLPEAKGDAAACHRLTQAAFDADGSLISLCSGDEIPALAGAPSFLKMVEAEPLWDRELFAGVMLTALNMLEYLFRSMTASARMCVQNCSGIVCKELVSQTSDWLWQLYAQITERTFSPVSTCVLQPLPAQRQAHRRALLALYDQRSQLWDILRRLRSLQAAAPDAWRYSGTISQIEYALHAQYAALEAFRQEGEP